jgi:Uma2 family endonuclease
LSKRTNARAGDRRQSGASRSVEAGRSVAAKRERRFNHSVPVDARQIGAIAGRWAAAALRAGFVPGRSDLLSSPRHGTWSNVEDRAMPGDFLRRMPQLTMEQFHAFRDTRPEKEKWELIDGVPMMMPPPTLMHQRIAGNLDRLLNAHLERVKPGWRADREVGVWLKGDEKYNPEPDVTVIDAAIALGQIYVGRFYFVAEVLSESDRKAVLDAKLAYYQLHDHNRCVLFIRQDRIGADQHDRQDGGWRSRRLRSATAQLAIPEIGSVGRLGDLYRFTPLDPFAQA